MNSPLDYTTVVNRYENTATGNDDTFAAFTTATREDTTLSAHRAHVESGKLGYGDPAFHAMWACLLAESQRRFDHTRALEIGVYKGQIISLWALIAREWNLSLSLHALGPLAGNPPPPPSFWQRIRARVDRAYREEIRTGNFYAEEDYEAIVRDHFRHHQLDFDAVKLWRGYSTDEAILNQMAADQFEIIYVDGDHREAGARYDFRTFGEKVVPGGWLVADDAGFDLPGTGFWKGYPEVTRALSELEKLGFQNVLNVGHNRIFQRSS